METEALMIHEEDIELNKKLGSNGAEFLEGGVLTVCNTGALATGGHGTALGMIRSAIGRGRQVHVYACETRPYNQGAQNFATASKSVPVWFRPCTILSWNWVGSNLSFSSLFLVLNRWPVSVGFCCR